MYQSLTKSANLYTLKNKTLKVSALHPCYFRNLKRLLDASSFDYFTSFDSIWSDCREKHFLLLSFFSKTSSMLGWTFNWWNCPRNLIHRTYLAAWNYLSAKFVWNTSTVNLEILNFIKRAEQQLTIDTYLILTASSFIRGKLCCVLRVCAKSSGKPWTSDLTVWWVFGVSFSLRSEIAKTTRNHKMQMTRRFHMEFKFAEKTLGTRMV